MYNSQYFSDLCFAMHMLALRKEYGKDTFRRKDTRHDENAQEVRQRLFGKY